MLDSYEDELKSIKSPVVYMLFSQINAFLAGFKNNEYSNARRKIQGFGIYAENCGCCWRMQSSIESKLMMESLYISIRYRIGVIERCSRQCCMPIEWDDGVPRA